jgi:hypothetical protein
VLVVLALVAVLACGAALAVVAVRRRRKPEPVRILAAAAPAPATISGDVDPLVALDALLAELERATVRIDGADRLDADAVVELERLADTIESAADSLAI